MSGSAATALRGTPQNPVLPEDPFIIIGTKLSLDPAVEDAAVPSTGIGAAGGVLPLDADGQIPIRYLQKLIAYLGGTYTPPTGTGTGATGGTGGTATGGTTTPTTPVAPATIADALVLGDGAYLADGDGAILLFPTGQAAGGDPSGGVAQPATAADALALEDGAALTDGDGALLLFPVGTTAGETATLALADGALLADGDGALLLFPVGNA